ncbi:hypothetical protein [Promicromonospora sp. NPDC060271]|uniref:hypothetical protein n=1 Tax=Promicromonospora sp. NPDC060271 TaxID=3347089 RepID=UPI00365B8596
MAPLNRALADSATGVAALLAEVGDTRVKWVEVFRDRLVVHPARQSEGAVIAAQLGITVATDYPATTPGFTMWTGRWNDLDLFVYSELRGTTRVVRSWPT